MGLKTHKLTLDDAAETADKLVFCYKQKMWRLATLLISPRMHAKYFIKVISDETARYLWAGRQMWPPNVADAELAYQVAIDFGERNENRRSDEWEDQKHRVMVAEKKRRGKLSKRS